jgi:acetyl-CoA synthetase
MSATTAFADARATLLRHRDEYDAAVRDFRWPALDAFN